MSIINKNAKDLEMPQIKQQPHDPLANAKLDDSGVVGVKKDGPHPEYGIIDICAKVDSKPYHEKLAEKFSHHQTMYQVYMGKAESERLEMEAIAKELNEATKQAIKDAT